MIMVNYHYEIHYDNHNVMVIIMNFKGSSLG